MVVFLITFPFVCIVVLDEWIEESVPEEFHVWSQRRLHVCCMMYVYASMQFLRAGEKY